MIAALTSALIVQETLGTELALRPGIFTVRSSLVELPLYVGLGVLSGGVALLFAQSSSRFKVALTLPQDSAPFAPLASLEAESQPQQPQSVAQRLGGQISRTEVGW